MKARIRLFLAAFVACTLVVRANTPPTVTDPLDAKIYTLKNGLTVMISVNKSEPRLQTMIAVRAGSKNDPSDNTGLAHYLEHLLFKGTDRFGTKDYAKEKVYLDQIESLYEEYNRTTDGMQRKAIYHRIDSVSGLASQYAIASASVNASVKSNLNHNSLSQLRSSIGQRKRFSKPSRTRP